MQYVNSSNKATILISGIDRSTFGLGKLQKTCFSVQKTK